ncbi:MAG TPA: hypothetical protein VF607_10500, partial [Verrucomicrobiae bacterium]
MSQPTPGSTPVTIEEIQKSWSDLTLRVAQLETSSTALETENKQLKQLLERAVEHRKKSHSELVNLLTTVVSKLQLNDVGVLVSRLMEHSQHVNEVSAALVNGRNDENIFQPALLKALDKTKRDLRDAIKPLVDELIGLNTPLDTAMLQAIADKPDNFFAPAVVR